MMTTDASLRAAARSLGLGEYATLKEIKQAYRKQVKQCHPDTGTGKSAETAVAKLTEAYDLLRHYCAEYRYALFLSDDTQDPTGFWMKHFGDDHIWGKNPHTDK